MSRRVLHFITELEVGGAERMPVSTLPRFDKSKFVVSVVYLHGDDLRSELERAGIRVTRLKSRSKFDLGSILHLARMLRDERIDILHTHLIQADILGYFAARRARVPVVVSTKHNTNYFQSHGAWLPPVDGFVNRRLSHLIAVSEAVKAFYVKTQKLAADRIEVIHNGIDLTAFQQAAPVSKAALAAKPMEKIVCCVGSLKEKKGHAVLLRAWPYVIGRCPDVRLVLVGDGPLRDELNESTNHSGIRDDCSISRQSFRRAFDSARVRFVRAAVAVGRLWHRGGGSDGCGRGRGRVARGWRVRNYPRWTAQIRT